MADVEFEVDQTMSAPFQKKCGFVPPDHIANTLDRVAVFRLHGDQSNRGISLLKKAADTDKRAAASDAGNEMSDLRRGPPNFRCRGFKVCAGIRVEGILVEQAPVRVLLREFVCFPDGAFGAEFGGGKD
jgi:hypothetical protein